jgi:hypothetical protein
MAAITESVKKRFKKHIDKAQNKIANAAKNEYGFEKDELISVFKYIAYNIFGFNEQKEIIDFSYFRMTNSYIDVKIENEIKYIIDISTPNKSIQNENLSKTIEYAMNNHVQWFVKTNGTFWDIYRNNCKQPDEYEKACSINFLELKLDNDEDLAKLFILCKESQNKKITTDLYNRNRWYGYLNEDSTSIDYMFLVNVCLYEDGSEKVYIPFFDVTYWCDEPFIARRNVERAIEKYLKDECLKEFDSEHRFKSIAYYKEADYLKKNVAVWW